MCEAKTALIFILFVIFLILIMLFVQNSQLNVQIFFNPNVSVTSIRR